MSDFAPELASYQLMDRAAVAEVSYLKAMHLHFIRYLADRYRNGEALDIARLCDGTLDRSGRLLGEVRAAARDAVGSSGERS